MPTNVLMPALSPTMEKGKLAKWLKKEGDKVKSGDILAEIETDKATMEVEAVDEGTLGKILIADGTDDVAVNTPIAVILGEGEKAGDIAAAPAPQTRCRAGEVRGTCACRGPQQHPRRRNANGGRATASSPRRWPAASPNRKVSIWRRSRVRAPMAASCSRMWRAPSPVPHPLASPLPWRSRCPTTRFSSSSRRAASNSCPHDTMRKIIARRLTESKQTIPHFYLSVDIGLDNLLNLRERLNLQAPKDKDGKPAWKVSVNDFVIKALAMALIKVPDANASWTETAMVKHKHADVGVAVSIPGGLITPVVRKAETKGLAQISIEMKDYAARARTRKLLPHEYQGGSSAVSNLGMMGIKNFSAVINPPHATILAVGTGETPRRRARQRHRHRTADERDAVHRSPRRRRRTRRRTPRRLQDVYRGTGADAGVRRAHVKTVLAFGDSLTWGADASTW